MFFVLSRAWHKEKILSPHEESSVSVSDSARISNVDSVMFVDRNKREGKF